MHDRRAARATHAIIHTYYGPIPDSERPPPTLAPWSLRLFGEEAVEGIEVKFDPEEPLPKRKREQARIQRLFPEARLELVSLDDTWEELKKYKAATQRTRAQIQELHRERMALEQSRENGE